MVVVRVMKCVGSVLIGIASVIGMLALVAIAASSIFAACLGFGAGVADHNVWLQIGCGLYVVLALIGILGAAN